MEFTEAKKIKLNKAITKLDAFVLDATGIISKHTSYVIVSGYVAILLGRTRTTEDIDVIIPEMAEENFKKLLKGTGKAGYWPINSPNEKTNYELLKSKHSIRIARKNELVPNIELKFAKNGPDKASLNDALTVELRKNKTLKIAPLELQIAYKEKILCSDKDIEDAEHLLEVFRGRLNMQLLEKYRIELGK